MKGFKRMLTPKAWEAQAGGPSIPKPRQNICAGPSSSEQTCFSEGLFIEFLLRANHNHPCLQPTHLVRPHPTAPYTRYQ
jgi:hypothetical protein